MSIQPSEYQQKIHQYSRSTLEMMSHFMNTEENILKLREIVMSSKTEQEAATKLKNLMREKTKSFMKILKDLELSEMTIKGITAMVWNNLEMMNKMVDYIEKNPQTTETQMINKAMEISNTH